MEKEVEFKKKHLQSLLSELRNNVALNETKYFHVNTIENLIAHFQQVKTENDKNWVYESLVEYFKKCSEFLPSIDRQTSKDLFDEYIDKITDYYHSNLGFVMLINRTVVYCVYILAISICYIFFSWYVVGIVIFFIIFKIISTYKKVKDKQVYGLFW